ncbi:hypothetical protein TorRG33x02_113400 [Trema orientale]|uniref:Uncharacterized protein n=1 Tax=Trema orientale TaxID=63057 RepID=A0A2P5F4N7_TREOI|nr:hypothetical protein TorRG33x02_113400 [Trema orientale]
MQETECLHAQVSLRVGSGLFRDETSIYVGSDIVDLRENSLISHDCSFVSVGYENFPLFCVSDNIVGIRVIACGIKDPNKSHQFLNLEINPQSEKNMFQISQPIIFPIIKQVLNRSPSNLMWSRKKPYVNQTLAEGSVEKFVEDIVIAIVHKIIRILLMIVKTELEINDDRIMRLIAS